MGHSKVFFLIYFLFSTVGLFGQDYSKNRIPCEKSVYLLNFYLIKEDTTNSFRNTGALYTFTSNLNDIFKKTCIEFQICKIDTIWDYNYFNVNPLDETQTIEINDIANLYYNEGAINIYWVGDYTDAPFMGICDSLPNKPRIFFSSANPNYQAIIGFDKLMLRYFGLRSTDWVSLNRELANGSNGNVAADSIWDTPADPLRYATVNDLIYFPSMIPYFYSTMKDANGDYYSPMITNIMSNYGAFSSCNILTHQQYQQLVINDRKCRRKRWGL